MSLQKTHERLKRNREWYLVAVDSILLKWRITRRVITEELFRRFQH